MQFASKIAETESWKFSANSASLYLCVKNDGNDSAHLKAVRPAAGPNQSRGWHFRQRGKTRRGVRRSRPLIRRPLPRRPSPIRVALRCRFRRPLRSRRSLLAGLAPWRVCREPGPPHSLCSLLTPRCAFPLAPHCARPCVVLPGAPTGFSPADQAISEQCSR